MKSDYRMLLGNVPLFSDLSETELDALAGHVSERKCRAREVIVWQDEPDDGAYVIVRGHFKVMNTGVDGREITLGIMGPGEVFGEIALLDRGTRSASVVALQDGKLLAISQKAFVDFLHSSPQASLKLLQTLARRLRRLTKRSEDLAFLDVSGRLAKKVIELVEQYGQPWPNQAVRIGLKLSQRELGDMIGATRESVNKHLRHWEDLGLLTQSVGHLVVSDVQGLKELASSAELRG